MDVDNIAIRLKLFMERERISNSQLADSCGIPRPTVSQLLNGRNKKISDIFFKLIHSAYPQLSIMWLMFGEGEMYIDSISDNDFVPDDSLSEDGLFSRSLFSPELKDNIAPKKSVDEFNGELTRQSIKENSDSSKIDVRPLRKVVSITVFYDDNSYEVFAPISSK